MRTNEDDRRSAVSAAERRGEAPAYSAAGVRQRRRKPVKRLLPLLIMAAIGVLIAREQVPAFADWWERTFTPAVWQARHTCREAAQADLKGGRYARLLRGGELQQTVDGPILTQMTYSVLDDGGEEQVVEYSCYLDSQGRLFRLNRSPE